MIKVTKQREAKVHLINCVFFFFFFLRRTKKPLHISTKISYSFFSFFIYFFCKCQCPLLLFIPLIAGVPSPRIAFFFSLVLKIMQNKKKGAKEQANLSAPCAHTYCINFENGNTCVFF